MTHSGSDATSAAGVRVLFLGTPVFALPSLQAVAQAAKVVAVVTQPDRPAGRGRRVLSPPVAVEARELSLPLLQPDRIRTSATMEELAALRPDLLVTVAYGRIIPRALLDLPPLGAINLHPSLLPAYRGASPIQRAIADGNTTTGITIAHMTDDLDAGDIILQREVPIHPDETAGDLEVRLARGGAALLVEAVRLIVRGEAPRHPQDHARATYVGRLKKEDGALEWSRPARELVNLIRAMNPWPSAYTTWRGRTLKVWRARPGQGSGLPGEMLAADQEGMTVAAGEGAVVLQEVQLEGGRRMSAEAFFIGHPVRPGERLGGTSGQALGHAPG